ncbi:sigma-E factor regulatory protein RseC [Vibrio inusitatus NBRC 102082]|uniref:Sigma-E factor regulatory protein RseC n=1 Tax=Vibrio inusitatus NBRC 102082 TaxID=1219070 RepID=A0A4Y3I0L8_9VIBR|nr:SoxR reducing system RseC family protein [Vibrio inusitatus]GEA52402.1 sigma-E factor regulatory protein RseC [Vibrio inusitatus NBRC 102082]
MMNALAQVTRVTEIGSPDLDEQLFKVDLSCEQQTSCNSCASKSSCATGQVTKAIGNKQHAWSLTTPLKVSEGDIVEIALPEKALLSAAALVYLVPLLFLFLGAVIGAEISEAIFEGQEWLSIVLGAGFALLSGMLVKAKLRRTKHDAEQQVTLIRTLGQQLEVK